MKKRLFRSRDNRVLGGVLGGIGDYFSIDPTLVRLIFVFLCLVSFGFPGILGYFIAYLIIPERV